MSKFGHCVVCDSRFHYSETSDLTVAMDMAGLEVPDICMVCEQEIRNADSDDWTDHLAVDHLAF